MSSIAHPSVTTTRGSMARADTQALALSPPESVISPVGFVYDSYANYHRRRTHEISSSLCIGRRLGGCHHISMRRHHKGEGMQINQSVLVRMQLGIGQLTSFLLLHDRDQC